MKVWIPPLLAALVIVGFVVYEKVQPTPYEWCNNHVRSKFNTMDEWMKVSTVNSCISRMKDGTLDKKDFE